MHVLKDFLLAAVIVVIVFVIASVLFSRQAEANAVSVFQSWTVSYDGTVQAFNNNIASSTYGLVAWMVKQTATSTQPWPLDTSEWIYCSGNSQSSTGGSNINGYIGINVFDYGIGEGNCAEAGYYWFWVGDSNSFASSSVQWAFRVQYDGVGVFGAQQIDGCVIGFDCPIVNSSSTVGNLTLECDPNSNFFSRSVCAVGIFLFVPNESTYNSFLNARSVLMLKLPFSLFGEFRNTFLSVNPASTTQVSLSVVVWPGEEAVDVLSTSTVYGIFGSYWSYLRNGLGLMLYLFFAWYLFFRVSNLLRK